VSKHLFKFEGFTDMINGEFVDDLTSLLHDVTTSGKTQTLYDVDAKNYNNGPDYLQIFQRGTCFLGLLSGQCSTDYDPKS
jgi:hypothetical protein